MRKASILFAVLCFACVVLAQQNYSDLTFTVVKDENGKPVRNASVVLHPVEKDGKQSKHGFELKTDSEGQTSFPAASFGKLRVQVLAPGYQTFGEDYDINQSQQEFLIKLKRPQHQYSIYGKKAADKKDDKTKEKPKEQ